MRLKKAIKKIVALGTGATMLGATLLGAMAADLADYPSPLFIKDGVFDGVIIVGENAAASDVIGSVDIATSLQYASTTTTTVSTGTSTTISVSGDSVKISESTNALELGETLSSVKSGITGTDLAALASGSISNEFGTFTYSQDITLGGAIYPTFEIDPNDDTNTPALYLKVNQSVDPNVYTYKISFSPALKSDHSTAASDKLEDIEDKKITILGKEYTIISTEHDYVGDVAITLMGGAVQDTIQEYETKTYTVNGKDYEVEVIAVSSVPDVILKVNGEVTNKLTEGETYKLSDGTEIGIKTLLENEGTETGGQDIVEFYLGANKIKIEDGNTNTSNWGGTVTVGSDTLDQVEAQILKGIDQGTSHGSDVSISSIEIRYNASEDLYVPVDGSMAEVAKTIEDEEAFIFGGFDIEFKGLEIPKTEEITLKPSGNKNYKLKFTNKNGDVCNQEIFATDGTNIFLGKYSGSTRRDLVINESELISDEEYFTVNKNKYSHILQLKDVKTSDKIVKLKDVCSGETIEVSYTGSATEGTGTLNLDGNRYKINVTGGNAIYADMNGDQTIDDPSPTVNNSLMGGVLFTELGLNISIRPLGQDGTESNNERHIVFTTEDKEDNNPEISQFEVYVTSSKLDMNSTSAMVIGGVPGALLQVGDSALYRAYDNYGTFFEQDTKSTTSTTDQDDLKIVYPDSQATAAVFVTSGVTTTTTSGTGGEVTTTTVNPIEVGAAKLDSEVSDVTAVNAIVVGGPCANAAAAQLTGVSKSIPECLSGLNLEEGKAIIKLYENGDKVAMLVAGATALDSRRACRVVANYDQYALSGTEVEVTGTSLTDITVQAPTQTSEEETSEETTEEETTAEEESSE